MVANIIKWGNSQGIIIPKNIMKECNFHIDEPVDIEVNNNELIIRNTFKHKSLEERAEAYGGKLGPFEEYDWGEPADGEVW